MNIASLHCRRSWGAETRACPQLMFLEVMTEEQKWHIKGPAIFGGTAASYVNGMSVWYEIGGRKLGAARPKKTDGPCGQKSAFPFTSHGVKTTSLGWVAFFQQFLECSLTTYLLPGAEQFVYVLRWACSFLLGLCDALSEYCKSIWFDCSHGHHPVVSCVGIWGAWHSDRNLALHVVAHCSMKRYLAVQACTKLTVNHRFWMVLARQVSFPLVT